MPSSPGVQPLKAQGQPGEAERARGALT